MYEINHDGRVIKKHADKLKIRHLPIETKDPSQQKMMLKTPVDVKDPSPQKMMLKTPADVQDPSPQKMTLKTPVEDPDVSSDPILPPVSSCVSSTVSPLVEPGTSQIPPVIRKSARIAAKNPVNYRE